MVEVSDRVIAKTAIKTMAVYAAATGTDNPQLLLAVIRDVANGNKELSRSMMNLIAEVVEEMKAELAGTATSNVPNRELAGFNTTSPSDWD